MASQSINLTKKTGLLFVKSQNRGVTWVAVLLIALTSCASPNYWGATATSYDNRAQKQYIKNQRGHNPNRRFQNSNQPTFGAQSVSKKGY